MSSPLLYILPFFLSSSNRFAHFSVLFHRPARQPAVRWEDGLMICCTAFDFLSRSASALQLRVSGTWAVALFSPSSDSRRPSRPLVRFYQLTPWHSPVFRFCFEYYTRCVLGVNTPLTYTHLRSKWWKNGAAASRMSHIIPFHGERVHTAANMATDEGRDDSQAFLLGCWKWER